MYMASTATLSLSGDLPQTITTPFWPTVIWQSVSFFSMLIIDPFLPIRRGIFGTYLYHPSRSHLPQSRALYCKQGIPRPIERQYLSQHHVSHLVTRGEVSSPWTSRAWRL